MKKEDTKQIAKKEKPAKPAKAPKANKEKPSKPPKELNTFRGKKVPKLFKKTYTQKQFEKQILGKLFIPEDKKYISSLFKSTGKNKQDVDFVNRECVVFGKGLYSFEDSESNTWELR